MKVQRLRSAAVWLIVAMLSVGSLLLAGCAAGTPDTTAPADTGAAETGATTGSEPEDQSEMEMAEGDQPFDLLFLDSMIEHHQAAITMAQQALNEATNPDVTALAQEIISAQEAEIAQMQEWRDMWYPDAPPTEGLAMEMGTMEIADDPTIPFEQRFVEAMIPHHEGAIAMAREAQTQAEHEEIRTLAESIIAAQEAEIAQMEEWQAAGF